MLVTSSSLCFLPAQHQYMLGKQKREATRHCCCSWFGHALTVSRCHLNAGASLATPNAKRTWEAKPARAVQVSVQPTYNQLGQWLSPSFRFPEGLQMAARSATRYHFQTSHYSG